ncbi:hypothetical protein [Microbispora bryophytorum]|uniref:hypothetical protein n=1 Tax=Microbispora bryophytorum TaxID=1460882 RepID=UPI0033DCA0A4
MRPADFFYEEEDPEWAVNGLDPWRRFRVVFNAPMVEQLRLRSLDAFSDLAVAQGLAQLAHDELRSFGTDGSQRLDDDDITLALRALRAVLKRLDIEFKIPFRDFKGFHGYWSRRDMGYSWAARRSYLHELFEPVFARLDELEEQKTAGAFRGVDGALKNIIFASNGPKPRIILHDAINNVIEVIENAQYCLFYDRPLEDSGLTWGDLLGWWKGACQLGHRSDREVGHHLYARLQESLSSPPETLLFRTYCERYGGDDGQDQPALLPQVYLHYDPRTRSERQGRPGALRRERMDFLLLLPHGVRIVIEVDGKQHYAEDDTASPRLYSEMVGEDRKLRLMGYEVYRFGGYELMQQGATEMVRNFFNELFERHIHNR